MWRPHRSTLTGAPMALIALLLASSGQTAEVFRWVDSEGNVYYSDAQPLDVESTRVDVVPAADAENGEAVATIQLATDTGDAIEQSAVKTAGPEQPPLVVALAASNLGPCERARQQLTLLHADVAVFLSDDGLWEGSGNRSSSRSWLADASRPNAIRAARDDVLRNCSNPRTVAEELSDRN